MTEITHTLESLSLARRAVLAESSAARAPSFEECVEAAHARRLWAVAGRVACWHIGDSAEDVLAVTVQQENYYAARVHHNGPLGWARSRLDT